MRAVVLARGLATRMRAADPAARLDPAQEAAARAGRKAMMPVGGAGGTRPRPFLDYVLGSLAESGYEEAALVVGPDHDDVRARYGEAGTPHRLRIAFVVQPEPRGTADAVLACERWAGRSCFTVVNADNLYPVPVLSALAVLSEPALPVFGCRALVGESGIPLERVAAFALVRIGPDGALAAIEEKPGATALAAAGPDASISMNCWRFDARIFAACRDVPVSPRGEVELPHAVALAMTRGVRFRAIPAGGPVLDLSRRTDVAGVSRRLAGRTVDW